MASLGLQVKLKGHAAHAAFPDQGISPIPAICDLISKLPKTALPGKKFKDFVHLSITHANSGRFGFGTIPGIGELCLTLRATLQQDLDLLESEVKKLSAAIAAKYFLDEQVIRHEPFTATINNAKAVEAIRMVATRHHYRLIELDEPFRWSEDFGVFSSRFPAAMFGLGAGENHSDLHTWYYDFPDEIMETGIRMFFGLIQDLLND
jgi:metal-dependent amidase/aminoacylase/carboxypeptidase family protein